MNIQNRKLLAAERESMILSEISSSAGSISALSRKLNVSEATVRRDLLSLEKQGRLKRVHGGAVGVPSGMEEPIFEEKESSLAAEKSLISRAALSMIEDGDSIYLDGGSTVLALAKLLHLKKSLTIVTNSISSVLALMDSGHGIIIVGGRMRALSRTLVGSLTEKSLGSLRFKKAFLGTIGFSVKRGISTTDPDEAYTKGLVMQRAEAVVLLADRTKIGVESFASSGDISDIDFIVSDYEFSPKETKELMRAGVKIVKA